MRRPLLRPVARLLLVALAPLALDGCVSIGVSRAALDSPPGASAPLTGALAVSVFEKAGDRDAGRVAAFPVLSELARVTGSGEEAVGRSMAPAWSLADLPPGKYRLRVTRRLTAEGDIETLENPGDKTFEVSAGGKTTLSVVLKKVPVFWIVVAALTIVALVILAIAGAVSYLERDGLLRFSPSRDFAPGETVTVTLDLSKLRGPAGREGSGKVSTSFLVPVARE